MKVFTKTVTEIQTEFGMAGSDVFFLVSAVKGPLPKIGDLVLTQVEPVTDFPFQYVAKRVQLLCKEPEQPDSSNNDVSIPGEESLYHYREENESESSLHAIENAKYVLNMKSDSQVLNCGEESRQLQTQGTNMGHSHNRKIPELDLNEETYGENSEDNSNSSVINTNPILPNSNNDLVVVSAEEFAKLKSRVVLLEGKIKKKKKGKPSKYRLERSKMRMAAFNARKALEGELINNFSVEKEFVGE